MMPKALLHTVQQREALMVYTGARDDSDGQEQCQHAPGPVHGDLGRFLSASPPLL